MRSQMACTSETRRCWEIAERLTSNWRAMSFDGMLNAKHIPKGPKGQKRPADVIGNAVHVTRILTGEIPDEHSAQDDDKNKAAVEPGRKGGLARAKGLSRANG
jgi:hypothetical protein